MIGIPATTVRHEGGDSYVVDGPFIEAKEHIGGFAVVEVGTLDQALELARTWPAGGSVEVRRITWSPANKSRYRMCFSPTSG
ncbi:MAG TPA: YciI family protein [Acidimicrobiales bacterium]|nr:YciI family protein [Acidimicrobiales bacterium]